MITKYERDIYLFLSLYRFFAYGLAVILIQGVQLDTVDGPPFRSYVLLSVVGIYSLLKVLGPLRWWRQDSSTYVVLGGDAVASLVVLLLTNGLDSPYLLYSLSPVLTASLLFREKLALSGASLFSIAITLNASCRRYYHAAVLSTDEIEKLASWPGGYPKDATD